MPDKLLMKVPCYTTHYTGDSHYVDAVYRSSPEQALNDESIMLSMNHTDHSTPTKIHQTTIIKLEII